MHIGKEIRRTIVRPQKIRRQIPLALPPATTPLPLWWPAPQREPAMVPALPANRLECSEAYHDRS